MENIEILEMPVLRSPVLIVGFAGWPNAGDVSTGALNHLIKALKAKKFAQVDPGPFYDFTTNRPVVAINEGVLEALQFAPNEFFYCSKKGEGTDLIFFQGQEPNLRWENYIENILNFVSLFHVRRVFTIGGTFDNIPHTVEPKVSALVSDERLKDRLALCGVEFTQYMGPISIHSFLLFKAKEMGLECISLWGHAPYYVQVHNVKVSYAVLLKIQDLLKIDLNLGPLKKSGDYLDEQVNKAIEKKPELKEYIRNLEKEYQESRMKAEPSSVPGQEKGEKVIHIEAFLKRYPVPEEDEED